MRKITLNIATSLDGFIEGPHGEIDWCLNDQDYGLTEFSEDTDALFMGRKSYELILQVGLGFFEDKTLYVFSDTLVPDEHFGIKIIRRANFVSFVQDFREQEGKNIWLFGGAGLVASFMAENLVDEFLISVHPLILGGGKLLFQNVKDKVDLMLIDSHVYSSGLIQLKYIIPPKFDLSMLDM
ncbi:dihydrofolate reductase family protein [Mucilaginibacter arboris]|uniref:Dihydrofolate reductase n=1 Tax=Mucilaginibacter arboris TaxID=2682090 RepID=A0A7K1SRM0_9SPHI|nr:dihydrofolate reductase family protein [Mucilaginibacter arboris]MVN19955.1 dihydrofolate reductase [Mucilaginibacter arboris]